MIAQTQSMPLNAQLKAEIRYVDIRVKPMDHSTNIQIFTPYWIPLLILKK